MSANSIEVDVEQKTIAICPECQKLIFPIFGNHVAPANSWVGEQDVDFTQCPSCGYGQYGDDDLSSWQIEDNLCLLEEKNLWIEFGPVNN